MSDLTYSIVKEAHALVHTVESLSALKDSLLEAEGNCDIPIEVNGESLILTLPIKHLIVILEINIQSAKDRLREMRITE